MNSKVFGGQLEIDSAKSNLEIILLKNSGSLIILPNEGESAPKDKAYLIWLFFSVETTKV